MRDWESHYQYLTKKFVEVSLDQLLADIGDSAIKSKLSFLQEIGLDSADVEEARAKREDLYNRVQALYALLRDRKFFTSRQRQVLSLLFGWNGSVYVGPKSISDIAKVLGIAQPVAFNHLRLAVKKLQKHFSSLEKKSKTESQG